MVSSNRHQFRLLIGPNKFFSWCDKCFDRLLFLPTLTPFLVGSVRSFRCTSWDEAEGILPVKFGGPTGSAIGNCSLCYETGRKSVGTVEFL